MYKVSYDVRKFEIVPDEIYGIAARVSHLNQKRDGTLAGEMSFMRCAIQDAGGIVGFCDSYVGSGMCTRWIRGSVVKGKELRVVALVTETLDRFSRPLYFHPTKSPSAQSTKEEVSELIREANGLPLMTYLHPDSSSKEVHAHRKRRGDWYALRLKLGEKGYLEQRKQEYLPSVVGLYKKGFSLGEIADLQNITKSDVQRWINQEVKVA